MVLTYLHLLDPGFPIDEMFVVLIHGMLLDIYIYDIGHGPCIIIIYNGTNKYIYIYRINPVATYYNPGPKYVQIPNKKRFVVGV